MAQLRALRGSWELAGIGLPRRIFRNTRLTVPICIALIFGAFAAAALLNMRMDRTHALTQARYFEQQRAADLAALAGANLDRLAASGLAFARDPGARLSDPAIRNIAVFRGGALIRAAQPQSAIPPAPVLNGARALFRFGPEASLAIRDGDSVIAVSFDPADLVPHALLRRAALIGPSLFAGGPQWNAQGARQQDAVPGWPLAAATQPDEDGALLNWRGLLPLYVFVILGPALAGGWLASLFVGAFERHEKAAHAIRALKTLRPIEAKLMVRLAYAERAAVEASRSKSEFIAHMSHELRTPLNAVIGFAQIIQQGLFGPPGHAKYAEYAGDIAAAGHGLHAKISDILEFANIEAGRHPLSPARVELASLVAACIEDHKGRAFSRRVSLDLGFALPGEVRADPVALRRILSNLIANALAYTGEGGAVLVDVRQEEGAGVVLVRDSGLGFSQAERRRAGHAFQRFDRSGQISGQGLGLAIAMELTRRMGGAMRLSSAKGDGSVMEVRLPRIYDFHGQADSL